MSMDVLAMQKTLLLTKEVLSNIFEAERTFDLDQNRDPAFSNCSVTLQTDSDHESGQSVPSLTDDNSHEFSDTVCGTSFDPCRRYINDMEERGFRLDEHSTLSQLGASAQQFSTRCSGTNAVSPALE